MRQEGFGEGHIAEEVDLHEAAIDFQEPYLTAVFGFLGITDVSFVRAEGVAVSPEQKQESIETAERQITLLKAA